MNFLSPYHHANDYAYQQVYGGGSDPPLSHELLAGAAAFAAAKAYEDHERAEGKPVHDAFEKELLAGLVGAELDRLIERGLMDASQRPMVQSLAEQQAMAMMGAPYGPGGYQAPDFVLPMYPGYGGPPPNAVWG